MICSTTYRTVLSLVGAVIMTLGTFSMLQASAPWDTPRSESVGYYNVDLSRPVSAERLYQRIHAAAERVCAPSVTPAASTRQRAHVCVDQAVNAAVAEVNHPQLSAVHSATMRRWQASNEAQVKPGV
jgi:UrcA family protein